MFSQVCVCSLFGGGTPSRWQGCPHPSQWGTPSLPMVPSQVWMGVPLYQVWTAGGAPSQVWMGVSLSQVWMGVPPSSPHGGGTPILPDGGYPMDGGTPTIRIRKGYPSPPRPGMGYPIQTWEGGTSQLRPGKGTSPPISGPRTGGGYPQPEQHSMYLLHGGRYAFCVHAGGLLSSVFILILIKI